MSLLCLCALTGVVASVRQKESTCMAPPSPSLYRLVSEEWLDRNVLLTHIKDHNEDLVWKDRYGNTALHKLCRRWRVDETTVEIVDAIISIIPDLVATPNDAGWTPLHYCVERRLVLKPGEDLMTMALSMIRASPRAVTIATISGFKRMTPFHLACEADADMKVLRAMLEVDPSLATRPCISDQAMYAAGKTPVQMLWQANENAMEKMALLLLTALKGHIVNDPMPMNHILHAACHERCPRDYLSRVLKEYPTQASKTDDEGNLPLHYAVRHASVESQAYTQFVLEELLQIYPQAASIPDNDGRLPLHVALTGNSRLTWHKGGIDKLVAANPEALYTLDQTDRLYPVLTSALHATQSRLHLSTTFELLLAAPGFVRHALHDG